MRYFYEKPNLYSQNYATTYFCNHPIYNKATLYLINNDGLEKGLCVIQQRFSNKVTWWENIDPWLEDELFIQEGFYRYFQLHAKRVNEDGLYPTVTIRSIMHSLGMKPLPKEEWETVFDRRFL